MHVSNYQLSLNTVNTFIGLLSFLSSHTREDSSLRNTQQHNTHLNFVFKRALDFSTLAIKLFNSTTSCFKLLQNYEPVFFLNVTVCAKTGLVHTIN